MAIGKQTKKFERWVLIGVVIILIATFSVSGISSQGCMGSGGGAGSDQDDYGGTFQPAPGKTRTVSNEDFHEVLTRYGTIYSFWGPSLRFADELEQEHRRAVQPGTWMHIVLTAAAEEAGYRVGDEELKAALRTVIPRWMRRQNEPFRVELYDRFMVELSRQIHPRSVSKAEFERTIKEMLLKDKLLADLVALERVPEDREAAFQAWKATRERVDLAFGTVPASAFLDAVKPVEETRSAISTLEESSKKLIDAVKQLRSTSALIDEWRTKNGDSWPADTADLLAKEPGKTKIGAKMHDDPWGRPLVYEKTPTAGRVLSLGPDGKPATPDDVTSETTSVLDALGTLRRVGDAVVMWYGATKKWPTSLEELTKAPPAEEGKSPIPAPLSATPKDPWGRELAWDAQAHTVKSAGPDGAPGTADDLVAQVLETRASVPALPPLAAHLPGAAADAWGRPLAVEVATANASTLVVRSQGPGGTPGDDDDVTTGNTRELQQYLLTVKDAHRIPARYEFEALYVVPSLVSDEIFAAAWKKFPEHRPDEVTAWATFIRNLQDTYMVTDGTAANAPAIDPKDPEKGYGAALRKDLASKGVIPKDAPAWPVPAAETFEDRKDPPAAGTEGLPRPEVEPLVKTYVEKGWRYVVLRDQFFAKMLDAMLKTARDSARAQADPKTPPTDPKTPPADPKAPPADPKTFASQVAELKDLQPSEADLAKGARFLQLFSTKPGEPIDRTRIEALPEIGDYATVSHLSSLRDGQYDVVTKALRSGTIQVVFRSIKTHADHDPTLAEVRDEIWPGYLEWRADARAADELERVRIELDKRFDVKPAADAPAPAPLDVDARLKAFNEALEAASKARGFPVSTDRTGLFVASTAKGEVEPKPPEGASDAEKEALRRRAFVRAHAYTSVSSTGKPTAPGTLGRNVLRDDRRTLGEKPTHAAYLALVVDQKDPSPEEFQGAAYAEYVRKQSAPRAGAGTPAAADRPGKVAQAIHRLYDDWETIKHDYRIETKVDLLVPKGAGPAR